MTAPITILATTYLPPGREQVRLAAFRAALASWAVNIGVIYDIADPPPFSLHIADDGTAPEWRDRMLRMVAEHIAPSLTTVTVQDAHGVGASLNAGLRAIPADHLILHAVDDWQLDEWFDIAPWADLLTAPEPWENVGLVRFFPHPTQGKILPSPAGWAVLLEPYGYAFGFRPFLAHHRFFNAIGPFQEDVSSMDCERDYAERYAARPGQRPCIAQAINVPSWTPIETGSLADIDPKSRWT